MLEIRFLDDDKLILDGKVLDAKVSSKTLAIIAMLILEKSHRLSKREIINALWPESSEEAAKYNLRFNLWQLKKIFESSGGSEFLVSDRAALSISDECEYFCDVEKILECIPENLEDADELKKLMDLFKNDFFGNEYFTDCNEFNDMVIMKRYSLENMHLRILKRFIELGEEGRTPEEILKAAEDALGIDPYDEKLATAKMKALIKMGLRREVAGFYHIFRMKFLADVGREPSSELMTIAEKLPDEGTAGEKRLNLRIFSMKEVKFFWMSEMLRALEEGKKPGIRRYLSEEMRDVLACVSAKLGTAGREYSNAKIMDTFCELMDRLVKDGYSISICDLNPKKADGAFSEFLHMAQTKWGSCIKFRQINDGDKNIFE